MAKHRFKVSSAEGFSSLDVVGDVFGILTGEPRPLELPAVDPDLPEVPMRLDEVRAWLASRTLSCRVRDGVWRDLATRARSEGSTWLIGRSMSA